MTIAKTIPKPRNWQDFERLCKKLYGELWNCSATIKLNGRNGQRQQGVDIYGVPAGAATYRGAQCKLKEDLTESVLTNEEVDAEIAKAKNFKPALSDFFIATTAKKDVRLEEYVRQRDVESRAQGGFSITLHCWDDLNDLIDDSRDTFNWWVKEQRHVTRYGIDVSFVGDQKEMLIKPKFRRCRTERVWLGDGKPHWLTQMALFQQPRMSVLELGPDTRNLSWVPVAIEIQNIGHETLEEYRLDFALSGTGHMLSNGRSRFLPPNFRTNVHTEVGSFSYRPHDRSPLTMSDSRSFEVFLRPNPACSLVSIGWQLFARDFTTTGVLSVSVQSEIDDFTQTIAVDDPSEADVTEEIIDMEAERE